MQIERKRGSLQPIFYHLKAAVSLWGFWNKNQTKQPKVKPTKKPSSNLCESLYSGEIINCGQEVCAAFLSYISWAFRKFWIQNQPAGSASLSLRTIASQLLLALFSACVQHPVKWEALTSTEAPGIDRAVLIFYLLCSRRQLIFYRWWIAWWLFRTFLLSIRKGSLFKNPHQLCVVDPKLFEQKIPYWNSLSSDKLELKTSYYKCFVLPWYSGTLGIGRGSEISCLKWTLGTLGWQWPNWVVAWSGWKGVEGHWCLFRISVDCI